MALKTPSRPTPFMANAILNFHFDYWHTSLTFIREKKSVPIFSKSTILSESVMVQSLKRMLGSRYFWDNPQNSLLSRWCETTQFSFNRIFFEVRHLSLAPGRQHDVEIFGSHVTTDDTPASSKSIQIFGDIITKPPASSVLWSFICSRLLWNDND